MSISDQDLSSRIRQLARQIGTTLRVEPRNIAVHLVDRPFIFTADVTWPPAGGRIVISRNQLTPSILAHEITHCLVPTPWLFFAEGLATWMGCAVAGDCADLCFAELDLDDVVRTYGPSDPLGTLTLETIATRDIFSPDSFHRLRARLAYASAASFLRWFCLLHPELPARVAVRKCKSPSAEFEALSGLTLPALEHAWQRSLRDVVSRGEVL